MNLVRKYKIYKSFNIVDVKIKEIFDFVDENLLNLDKFEINKYKNWLLYMDFNGNCILEYNLTNQHLFVKYQNFCEVLENKYNFIYFNIKEFIKYKVETTYKLKIKIIEIYIPTEQLVEREYKLKKK